MQSETDVVFKLGQKVRPEPEKPEIVKLTNMYLSEKEYDTVAQMGGSEIRKIRRPWTPAERPMIVDEFEGRLAGLVMAEVELSLDERRLDDPPLVVADVTDDDRFSGGRLAETSAAVLAQLLLSLS
jgi:CYTH domain-containing protein